jgi:signal transduction histidine kinase
MLALTNKTTFIRLLILLLISFVTITQVKANEIDSLKKVLSGNIPDTTRVSTLCELAQYCLYKDTVLCRISIQDAIKLSKKINYAYGLGLGYNLYGTLLELSSADFHSAEKMYLAAKLQFESNITDDNIMGIGLSLSGLSNIAYYRGKFTEAIKHSLAAIDKFKLLKNEDANMQLANQLVSIGQIYHHLKQFDKAIPYYKKALEIRKKLPKDDPYARIENYLSLAYDLAMNKEYEASKELLYKVEKMPLLHTVPELKMEYYEILGSIAYRQGDGNESVSYYLKSLQEAQKTGSKNNVMIKYFMIGQAYDNFKKPQEAITYLNKCLPYFKTLADQYFLVKINLLLANNYEMKGDFVTAYTHLKTYIDLNDSIQKANNIAQVNEIDSKYQNLQKEKEINELKNEKTIQNLSLKQKNQATIGLTFAIFSLSIIFMLFYKGAKRKQLLALQKQSFQEQEILQLKQVKQLQIASEILNSQEEERNRIAKDLHDGLGGMLSSIKLNLSSINGNIIINDKDATIFSKSLTQIDLAIKEMRRVAHNMMPETLLKFGIVDAIADLCDFINEGKNLNVLFTPVNFKGQLNRNIEVSLYRIVQELINNAIKYSQCKNIIVQLSNSNTLLTLVVEDDGIGFALDELSLKKGTGIENIKARVSYLNGLFTIESTKGKGATFIVEIPLYT